MLILQIYLFLGLVLHKIVWEVLRNRTSRGPSKPGSGRLIPIKAVKIGILTGILVQVWLPDLLPISTDPFLLRFVGTMVYTTGLLTALAARFQLGENWSNIEEGRILQGQHVVATGIYAYVRHPIYIGDLLLLLGLELALNSWLVVGVLAMAPIVIAKAFKEEQMLVAELHGYEAYRRSSKRFIPFVF